MFIFNNLHNARVDVNETAIYCRSLMRLYSHILNFGDFNPFNAKYLNVYVVPSTEYLNK